MATAQQSPRCRSPPNLSCRYFTHATETIIWAAKNKKSRHKFNYALMKQINGGKQMKSVWQIPPPEPWEKRFGKHPTQKPVALVKRVLLAASNEGDVVLGSIRRDVAWPRTWRMPGGNFARAQPRQSRFCSS